MQLGANTGNEDAFNPFRTLRLPADRHKYPMRFSFSYPMKNAKFVKMLDANCRLVRANDARRKKFLVRERFIVLRKIPVSFPFSVPSILSRPFVSITPR